MAFYSSSVVPSFNQNDPYVSQPPANQPQPQPQPQSQQPLSQPQPQSHMSVPFPPSEELYNDFSLYANPPASFGYSNIHDMSSMSAVPLPHGDGRYRQSIDSASPISIAHSFSPPFDQQGEFSFQPQENEHLGNMTSPLPVMNEMPGFDYLQISQNLPTIQIPLNQPTTQIPLNLPTTQIPLNQPTTQMPSIYSSSIVEEPGRMPLNTVHEEPLPYPQPYSHVITSPSNRRISFPPVVERTFQGLKGMMNNVRKRNVSQTSLDKSARSSTASTKYTGSISQNVSPQHSMGLSTTNLNDEIHVVPLPTARVGATSPKRSKLDETEPDAETERKKEKDRAKSKKSAGTMHKELDLTGEFIKENQEEMRREGLLAKNEFAKNDRKFGRPKVATLSRSILKRLWTRRNSANATRQGAANPDISQEANPDDMEAMESKRAQLMQELERLDERINRAKHTRGLDSQLGGGGHS